MHCERACANADGNPFLIEALRLAGLGYAVFPCRPGRKEPATAHGVLDATTDEATIRKWWARWPDANLALATGRGLVVVDVDPGAKWPSQSERESIRQLRPPLARTPRNGWHIYFRVPDGHSWRNSASRLAEHVDTRADGGYVLVSPSRTERGRYVWVRPLVPLAELPEPPDWLVAELDRVSRPVEVGNCDMLRAGNTSQVLYKGQRNCGLASLAGALRRRGLTQSEIEAALLVANRERCVPPLPEAEVLRIARSIARYPPGPGAQVDTRKAFDLLRASWQRAIRYRLRRKRSHL
jgi:catechol 2,3-dioxygenase-like lactoylglutathione lyase family enzyme